MTPQELRNSILQLAIQGKLVEQRPEEGTAEELYQQIQAEKQRLIVEGKIKKEKPLPEITEDEIPFDIPESWKWVRVGRITSLNPKNDLDDNLDVSFIPMSFIADGFRNQHTSQIRKWKEIKKDFTHFANGDIGIAKITPCFQNRKSVIFKDLENGFGAGTTELSIVRVLKDTLVREYLLWFFKTEYFISNGVRSFTGTAGQQRIHKDYLATCLIPLPPLAEQKRIVAKIEELLPYVDRYEKAWSKLEELNKRFPIDLEKSILQMAIQGKLVEQRPEEGTADELYQQIQAEKQRLIKEGKIKKEKPLPEISEDEIPFDIPESWKWVRLGEIISLLSGTDLKPEEYNDAQKGIPYITGASSLSSNGVLINRWTETPRVIAHYGDVLLVCKGSGYGKTVICDIEQAHIARQIMAIKHSENICMKYIKLYLEANLTTIKASGQGVIPGIDRGSVLNMLFPLPPLAEQKRIVAKIEELLPLCEKLKK